MTARRVALWAGLLLFTAALLLPAPEGLSPRAQRTGAVALLMSAWWIGEALPIAATSLLPLVLFPLLGILGARETATSYGDPIVYLFLGAFMIALAMERWGLHRRIALAMISAIGATPERLVLGFLSATAGVSMWINNTAATLMLFPVGVAVVEHVCAGAALDGNRGEHASDAARASLGAAVMLGVAYGASIGGLGTLVGTAPNLVFAGALRKLFPALPEVSFLSWLGLGLPLVLGLVALAYPILLKLAPEVSLRRFSFGEAGRDALREERIALGAMSQGERFVLAGFVAAALLWVSRAPLEIGGRRLPGWSSLLPEPGYVHDATVAVGIGLVLMLVPARGAAAALGRTARLLDWTTVQERVPWGVLLLMGGGFALAAAFEATGLSRFVGEQLRGLGALPLPVVIAALCLATTLLSEVASNTATATMLMPVLAATATAIGAPPLALMVPATLAASCGFMLPVATPPNAIVFGTGWISMGAMARAGAALDLAGIVLITILCSTLVPWIWGGAGG